MKLLLANVLPICLLGACVWFVHENHPGFAIACLCGCMVTAHTYRSDCK